MHRMIHNSIRSPKIVIVGGVAGGATAAARARRLMENAEIIMVERGPDISFANCGLPYYIGGEISNRDKLLLHTPSSLNQQINIDIKTETEALSIDRKSKTIKIFDKKKGKEEDLNYDKLILSTGAYPFRPNIPGLKESKRIFTLRTLQDMDLIHQNVLNSKEAVVIGAGFIGLEMVEALVNRGLKVTVLEKEKSVLPQMDSEITRDLHSEMISRGVNIILEDSVVGFENNQKSLGIKLSSGKLLESNFAILSIGVRPESKLASDAGLEINKNCGTITVNDHMQTSDPDIYAIGDAVETNDFVMKGIKSWIALGGPANRQGRIAADHIFMGENAPKYRGNLGTAIVRVFDCVAAVTGWTEKRLKQNNFPYKKTVVSYFQHSGYFPNAFPLKLKIMWNPTDGHLIGAEAIGIEGVDKRIDVLSTAISGNMTVDDLCNLELSYAPPFGSAKDIVNLAGYSAQNIQQGLVTPYYDLSVGNEIQIVDVREKEIAEIHPIENSLKIPLTELRQRFVELPKDKKTLVVCETGKTSYFASRILSQEGFQSGNLVGGLGLLRAEVETKPTIQIPRDSVIEREIEEKPLILDACGISCPGPIMAIKKSLDSLKEGQQMKISATDPGFVNDVSAFCKVHQLDLVSIDKTKGKINAVIKKQNRINTVKPLSEEKPTPNNKNLSIICFSQELDKVLACFILANGACAMGGSVNIFFTFWGLNALKKSVSTKQSATDHSFMEKAMGLMMPKGVGNLPLSHFNIAGFGSWMMKHTMEMKQLPNLPNLLNDAKNYGVRMVACSMSMEALGISKEELIDGIEIGGVADFLASAQGGQTLFI